MAKLQNRRMTMETKQYVLKNASYYGNGFVEARHLEGMMSEIGFAESSESYWKGRFNGFNHMHPSTDVTFIVYYMGDDKKDGVCIVTKTYINRFNKEETVIVERGSAENWHGDSIVCSGKYGRWNFHVEGKHSK